MRRIYKHKISPGENRIENCEKILHVESQDNLPCLWYIMNTVSAPMMVEVL